MTHDSPFAELDLKKVAGTSGGEYAGPCPKCGGNDRFRVWPNHSSGAKGGRFLCRQCGAQGDGIEFLKWHNGMAYQEAAEAITGNPQKTLCRFQNTENKGKSEWKPEIISLPCEKWSKTAGAFIESCEPAGQAGLDRGLTAETCAALKIVWNPKDRFGDRTAWGLEPETKPNGKPRKMWFPRGLIIPNIRDGLVIGLKIRRADWKPDDSFSKYAAVTGSAKACYLPSQPSNLPLFVVESELDAALLYQEALEIAQICALTTAKAKPDPKVMNAIKRTEKVLVALDNDSAGIESWKWWRDHIPGAMRFQVPDGKDLGEFFLAGGNLKAWSMAWKFVGKGTAKGKTQDFNHADKPSVSISFRRQLILADLEDLAVKNGLARHRWRNLTGSTMPLGVREYANAMMEAIS